MANTTLSYSWSTNDKSGKLMGEGAGQLRWVGVECAGYSYEQPGLGLDSHNVEFAEAEIYITSN